MRRRAPTARSSDAGYSLVEVMVVMVIVAILVGLVGPRVIGYLGRARAQSAEVQIGNISAAMDLFLLDVGRYPTEREGLSALIQTNGRITGWRGPYLGEDALPTDPWGRPFRYDITRDGQSFRIFTYGADDQPGGEGENADIGV